MAIVLLHGWGMNKAVYHHYLARYAPDETVINLDLPGFGDNQQEQLNYSDFVAAVSAQVPAGSILVGWSLGGLVAQSIALQRNDLRGLVTVASTPRFVAHEAEQDRWFGIEPAVLSQFSQQLTTNVAQTIQRFLAIQAMGSVSAKADIQAVRTELAGTPTPSSEVLQAGLTFLQTVDLRAQIKHIACPTMRIYGRRDALVPKAAIAAIEALQPQAETAIISAASHAPFISHPEAFQQHLAAFCANL